MKSSTGKIAPLVCMVAVCVSSSTSAQRRARPAAVRSITPTEYAAKVAGIEDCATFKARASSLPNAAPLLSSMVAGDNEAAFRKGEFETNAQHASRLQALLTAKVGDPDHLVIRVPIEPYKVTYDADAQTSTIKFMLDGTGYSQRMKFSTKDNSRRQYVGSNAFGVTADVTSIRSTDDTLIFKKRQRSGSRGGVYSPQFDASLSPEQARSFKDTASVLLLVGLTSPFIEGKSSFSEATLDSPYALSTRTHSFSVDLRCAVLVSGDAPVAELQIIDRPASFDRDPLTGRPS